VGTPPTTAALTDLTTAVNALTAQITKSPAAGNNIGISTSFAHATAAGVELTQVFDRPLAFGYQADFADIKVDDSGRISGGIDTLCAIASPATAVPPKSKRDANGGES
jgi:hypothetical protein